jgi:hypothetical protein
MLLMTLVIAAMCAGLYRASQVPAFVQDLSITLGWDSPPPETEVARTLHVYFLLFTYTSPLILAGFLSTLLGIRRWFFQRTASRQGAAMEEGKWLAGWPSDDEVTLPPSGAGLPPVAPAPPLPRSSPPP